MIEKIDFSKVLIDLFGFVVGFALTTFLISLF